MDARVSTHKYRSIWISDIHLGTPGCKASFLLDFLRCCKSDNLYLVGDIVDGWSLRQNWYWPQAHNDVIQKIMREARKGTRVIFIPGNHDEFARGYVDHDFGAIQVAHEYIHTTVDGRKFLVLHGDEFDVVVKYARWLAYLGDWSYGLCLKLNDVLNEFRLRFGYPYWSLSAYLKLKVKNAVKFIADFETALADVARERGVDGVICGHIHHPEIRDIDGILYCNDGDWVESCTALVEHFDGRLEIIHWMQAVPPVSTKQEKIPCESSSLPTPGIRKSTVSSGHSRSLQKS
ncbi:MAG: UDP-2,3-diacylglucosamine hydrolase [Sneathiella sp.]|jgi:UDP-2,3-diacylglucosamine pyrophosphatase LpxH|uniref:UDP-2,3-diacylglucosamine diphosphatase n=1 Tax=Sneathiella sp. TaxID=1964365 RepID=UPI000C351EFE|nr:UDP-2,3-diacylglucosamine diphosphatase [Sneathiella sp.]MAL77709.1 UDP-2,3-diacylglucosamine hydrolase [Sneathiella sp.]